MAARPRKNNVSVPNLYPLYSRIAIPLSLRLNAINWSLREVITRCRDYAVSPYLVHFSVPLRRQNGGLR